MGNFLKSNSMKKIILKRTRYNNLPETISGIIISTVFIGFILYKILSGAESVSSGILIGGFIFFAVCFIFYLWQLFAKKSQARHININGWEYRLFQKVDKWKFICISGFVSSVRIGVIVAILLLSRLIKNDMPPYQAILIVIGLCMISTIPYGYMNYKNCKSVDMDSDFTI